MDTLYSEKTLRKMAKESLKRFDGYAKYKGFSIHISSHQTRLMVDFFLNPSGRGWESVYCPGFCRLYIAI